MRFDRILCPTDLSPEGDEALRYASALARALPDLPQAELYWRVHFAMGSLALALRGTGDWEAFQGVLEESGDTELMLRRLVNFLEAAFRAPLVRVPASSMAVGEER